MSILPEIGNHLAPESVAIGGLIVRRWKDRTRAFLDRGNPKMRILLVEDHSGSRAQVKRLLELRGHDVVAVGSAEEAEGEIARQPFPFLILDWMLPGKSGLDLCRELRARPSADQAFILLVTARNDPQDLEQALEAGANDYLTKPLDVDLLQVRLSVAERRISELKERAQVRAELHATLKRMVDILENTSDGFFALDRDWRFSYLNAKAEVMLGQSRAGLLGRDVRMEFPSFVGSVFEQNYARVMRDQIAIDFEAVDSVTGKKCYEVKAYPNGGGVSIFFRDITERKRLEEERFTTTKLESLGTLAGGIAHDLNNILTVISGNIGLAETEAPGDARVLLAALAKADQATQHAARLSGQLLTFSKGGAPVKQVASVAEPVRQAAEFSLYGSNLQADVEVAPELWRAEIDRGQIEQVINALLINAREAMPLGGKVGLSAGNVYLEERSIPLLPAGRYIKVAVSDAGGGIDDNLAKKIFDPYFTTKTAGSGLGLSISYSIIRKHGGLLHLESSSSKGSIFAFYLPAADQAAIESQSGANEGFFPFHHHRILVMDDEAAIRDLTSQLLGTLGYEATAVPNGHEAVLTYERALRRGESFQAVILDATVRGGMGGLATIQRLRSMDPNVTAIICSGYSDEAALSEFLAYGFRGALPKPFSREELADVLHRAFQGAKSD